MKIGHHQAEMKSPPDRGEWSCCGRSFPDSVRSGAHRSRWPRPLRRRYLHRRSRFGPDEFVSSAGAVTPPTRAPPRHAARASPRLRVVKVASAVVNDWLLAHPWLSAVLRFLIAFPIGFGVRPDHLRRWDRSRDGSGGRVRGRDHPQPAGPAFHRRTHVSRLDRQHGSPRPSE